MKASSSYPRIIISALRGGAGKTTLTLGIIASWKKLGREIAPFKKGPDYIDSAWLSIAAGNICHNLDTFLMKKKNVQESFFDNCGRGQCAVIEGNRGLYDGSDLKGTHSTAELAKLLKAPLILILDCNKLTRTAAAMIMGCQKFDSGIDIKGVILNRVANSRHETIIKKSIEGYCNLPVLGAVPRLEDFPFPERHLGLIPPQEHYRYKEAIYKAQELVEKYLDVERIWKISENALPLFRRGKKKNKMMRELPEEPVIGILRDSAFHFYYPENLDSLWQRGARLIEVSALKEKELPAVDALYIGGGFPETHAHLLAENKKFRSSIRREIEKGLPVYAECGGLIYLGKALTFEGKAYPMANVLPMSFAMEKRPQGHGYTILKVEKANPFFKIGEIIKGHEFHYSGVVKWKGDANLLVFRLKRGIGIDGQRDGICYKNVLALYSHIHALGVEGWADAFVEKALLYRIQRKVKST